MTLELQSFKPNTDDNATTWHTHGITDDDIIMAVECGLLSQEYVPDDVHHELTFMDESEVDFDKFIKEYESIHDGYMSSSEYIDQNKRHL